MRLTDLADMSAGENSLAAQLLTEPYELLVQVLWSMVEDQAEESSVTPKDFGTSLWGDALQRAAEALTATVADFFTNPAQREAFKSLLEKTKTAANLRMERARDLIAQIDPDLLAKISTDSSSKPAASVEQTPTNES